MIPDFWKSSSKFNMTSPIIELRCEYSVIGEFYFPTILKLTSLLSVCFIKQLISNLDVINSLKNKCAFIKYWN